MDRLKLKQKSDMQTPRSGVFLRSGWLRKQIVISERNHKKKTARRGVSQQCGWLEMHIASFQKEIKKENLSFLLPNSLHKQCIVGTVPEQEVVDNFICWGFDGADLSRACNMSTKTQSPWTKFHAIVANLGPVFDHTYSTATLYITIVSTTTVLAATELANRCPRSEYHPDVRTRVPVAVPACSSFLH